MWAKGKAHYFEHPDRPGRSISVTLDLRGVTLTDHSGQTIALWPYGQLRRLPYDKRGIKLAMHGGKGSLVITERTEDFETALREVHWQGGNRIPRSFIVATLTAVLLLAGIVVIVLWALSRAVSYVAPFIPEEIASLADEAALPGILSTLGASDRDQCRAPAGVAALTALGDRLKDSGSARPLALRISVYRSKVPNALALPGGTIILTDSLLRRIETPDAFAGVLAHEIGHVHYRHGLKQILHQGGIALLIAALTGASDGFAEDTIKVLLGTHYSREAEREADRFAVDAVAAAGGNPRALGPFLVALSKNTENDTLTFLSTHPLSEERQAAIEAQAADRAPRPGILMGAEGWKALSAICD